MGAQAQYTLELLIVMNLLGDCPVMRWLIRGVLVATLATAFLPAPAFAQGGPPLITDDPDTPGPGHWEINIAGGTGLKIPRAIVAGHHDPEHLASHRDYRCRASRTEIIAALTGHYRPEHLFVLQQNLELFDTCQIQMAACDRALEAQVQILSATQEAPATPLPAPRVHRRIADSDPHFEIRTPLHQVTGGVDLTQIDGIGPYTALKLIAEIGTDMHRWATKSTSPRGSPSRQRIKCPEAVCSARGRSHPPIVPR
jgi:hypothetical protein